MVFKYLVGTSYGIWVSENGINFTQVVFKSHITDSYLTRKLGNKYICQLRDSNLYLANLISQNPSDWQESSSMGNTIARDGFYDPAKGIVIVGHNNFVAFSQNGDSFTNIWSPSVGPFGISFYSVCNHDGDFVVAGSDAYFYTSGNGLNWQQSYQIPTTGVFCMRSAFGRIFVAGPYGQIRSAETLAGPWTTHDFGPDVINVCMTYENGVLVIGCDNGVIKYTTDGVNWSYTGNGQGLIRRIVYSGGKWYSVSDNSTIGVSTNFPNFVNTPILFTGSSRPICDIAVYKGTKINGTFSGSGVRAFMSIKSMGGTLEIPIASQTASSLTIDPAFIENWGRPSGPVKIMVVDGEYVSDWIDWEFK